MMDVPPTVDGFSKRPSESSIHSFGSIFDSVAASASEALGTTESFPWSSNLLDTNAAENFLESKHTSEEISSEFDESKLFVQFGEQENEGVSSFSAEMNRQSHSKRLGPDHRSVSERSWESISSVFMEEFSHVSCVPHNASGMNLHSCSDCRLTI